MAEPSPEREPASSAAADAGTPTLGTPEGEGLVETDVANWMREKLATEVSRLNKLGAKVVTMQVKNCCVVREELTEAEIAAEAAAASSGAGAEPKAAAPKPAGKRKRRGGRRRKGAAAKAARAKADASEAAVEAAAEPPSCEDTPAASEVTARAKLAAAGAGEKEGVAAAAAGEKEETTTTGAKGDAEEDAEEDDAEEEEEAAALTGPTRLVNRLEVDTTFDFDLVSQLLLSPPIDCPVKEGYKLVTLVLLEKRAPTPRLLSYLYQADMPDHSLDRWIFINRELKESYHVVSFE